VDLLSIAALGLLAGSAQAASVRLDRQPALLTELSLPSGERNGPADRALATGPWRVVATVGGVRTWETALPARTRTLFFHRPPGDVDLVRAVGPKADRWARTRPLSHRQGIESADRADTWEFSSQSLRVRRKIADGPPGVDEYAMGSTVALGREAALNLGSAGLSDSDARRLALRSVQVDDTTRHGLYLPAPARAVFEVRLPEGAVLQADATLLPPEALSATSSDGAWLQVDIEDGVTTTLGRWALNPRQKEALRLDLTPWAGKTVRLQLTTEAGQDGAHDYVFLAEPRLVTPEQKPPRLVVIFLDTVRVDHLPMYGYERNTTPTLQTWSQGAAVFTEARSVAPWTLPSTRTMLTGAQPERWSTAPRLQNLLAQKGWATAFLSGNVYLSSNFEMSQGWGTHRSLNWPRAQIQVDRAMSWLRSHADEPAFLMLHFMDAHLPYHEPIRYRSIFAGKRPEYFDSDGFLRSDITSAGKRLGDAGKQYVRDRYDGNLRYIDDQLSRLLSSLDDDAIVAIVADHGEEFWDHDGFEHGHTLYDELLRVPVIIRAPGLAPGRYDGAVSLLDLAPTLLKALDIDSTDADGLPLQGLTDGSDPRFQGRKIGFGRPLYGEAQWGVAAGGEKYITSEGIERVFDLSTDPGELDKLPDPDLNAWRFRLGDGVGRPAGQGFRLTASKASGSQPTVAQVTVPSGVLAAFAADDPLETGPVDIEVDDTVVTITWRTRSGSTPREVFVMPKFSLDQATPDVDLQLQDGALWAEGQPVRTMSSRPGARPTNLLSARADGRTVTLGVGVAPIPDASQASTSGYDAEVSGDLEALGYIER
jgi:arylsulfatase A-like enzyme